MFATLDDFDWSSVEHAYGEASDVPAMIRGMASSNGEVRKRAYYEAYGNIWHQGTVYEASAYAVPHIIEVACNPKLPDREQAINLLSDLACGNSYLDVHQHLTYLRLNSKPNFEEEKMKELKWVMDTTMAVEKGRDKYLNLLHDENAKVRAHAANLLSKCKENTEDTVKQLVEMFNSSDEQQCRQAALFSATRLVPDSEMVVECAKKAVEENDFRMQALGAYVLLQNDQLPLKRRHIEVVIHVMMNEEGETWQYDPIGDGFEQSMAQAFNDCIDEHGEDEKVARLILEAMKNVDFHEKEMTPALSCLLKAAFGNGAPSKVSGLQQEVIQLVESACVCQLERKLEMRAVVEELSVKELFSNTLQQ